MVARHYDVNANQVLVGLPASYAWHGFYGVVLVVAATDVFRYIPVFIGQIRMRCAHRVNAPFVRHTRCFADVCDVWHVRILRMASMVFGTRHRIYKSN